MAHSSQMLSSATSRPAGSLSVIYRISEDDETADQIEDEFLRGNFRQALAHGNRLLRRRPPQTIVTVGSSSCSIHSFALWKACYELRVHVDDAVLQQQQQQLEYDRVGAVVLQAWYELWKLQNNKKENDKATTFKRRPNDDQEQKHLMPFLETFCSGKNSSMSLDLAWMWVQFLWTTIICDRSTCVTLVLHLFQFAARHEKVSESELLFLVCEVLPCLKLTNNKKNDDSFWNSWYLADEMVPGSSYKLSPYPNKESIEALQRTLPSLTSRLDLSPAFSKRLERRLNAMHQRAMIDASSSALVPALPGLLYPNNDMSRSPSHARLPENFWKRIQVQVFNIVRRWILLIDQENGASDSCWSRQNRAMAVALCVISGWWTWRNSRRLVQLLKLVVRMAAAPARELLQALLPRQQEQIANHPSA